MRVEFPCDATGDGPARLRSLGADSISAMAMPNMSNMQTLYETKGVKPQLLDGKGVAVERIHYANQLAFVVVRKAIAFDQRRANEDVAISSTFCTSAATCRRVLVRLSRSSNRGKITGHSRRCTGERVGLPSSQLLHHLRHGGPFHKRSGCLWPISQARQRR